MTPQGLPPSLKLRWIDFSSLLGTSLTTSGTNFDGEYVDYAVYLERYSDGVNALGMDEDSYDRVKAKGSTSASALISSTIGLIYEVDPNLSPNEVKNILKNSASMWKYVQVKSQLHGYGVVDVGYATVLAEYGIITSSISGNGYLVEGTNTWTANVSSNASGSITYQWYWDGNYVGSGSTYSRYYSSVPGSYDHELELIVTTSAGQYDESQRGISERNIIEF